MELAAAQTLALNLIAQHLPGHGYSFEFDRSKTRFGCCNTHKKILKLSCYLVALNSEEETRDTILHEIAHALAPPRTKGRPGVKGIGWHGPEWKAIAARIGAKPERCYSISTVVQPKYNRRLYDRNRFTATCSTCRTTLRRSRTPVRHVACGRCCKEHNHGKYDPKFLLTWRDNKTGRVGTTLPKTK